MSSIRPQQRQVKPLVSSSLTTHEAFRRNCKVSAEQDKSKWPDPGLAALVMLLRFHGLGADPERIRHRFGRGTIGIPGMLRCAKELGLKARSRLTTWERLVSTPMPAIVALRDGGFLLLGMAITGHQSLEEVERYTRAARKAQLADSAMSKLKR